MISYILVGAALFYLGMQLQRRSLFNKWPIKKNSIASLDLYVKSDTEEALKMFINGGMIFWHDYRDPKRNRDVYRALNELTQTYRLKHIEKTSLVFYSSG